MPNSHGTKKAYTDDKCRCDDCVSAMRERWNRRDERRKAQREGEGQAAGGGKTAVPPPAVGGTDGGGVAEFPQVTASRAPLAEVYRLPAPSRSGLEGAGIEIPRLWPTSTHEPEYAEEHRAALSATVAKIIEAPETYYRSLALIPDTSRAEARNFARLIDMFRKANPGLIDVDRGSYRGFPIGTPYSFTIYSPEYVFQDEGESGLEDLEPEAEPEPVSEPMPKPAPVVTPVVRPLTPVPRPAGTTIPRKNAAWYRVSPNTKRFCCVFEGDRSCNICAGGRDDATYLVRDGHSGLQPACYEHFTRIQQAHPERVQFRDPRQYREPTGPIRPAPEPGPFPQWGLARPRTSSPARRAPRPGSSVSGGLVLWSTSTAAVPGRPGAGEPF